MSMQPHPFSPVHLRAFRASDEPLIENWFPEAAAAVVGEKQTSPDLWPAFRDRWLLDHEGIRHGLLVVNRLDAIPIGLLTWEYRQSTAYAVLRFLTLGRAWRGRGYGAEAIYLWESLVKATTRCVPLPPHNGRALYFWLRLGYRPLLRDEQPAFMREEGGAWMARKCEQKLKPYHR